MIHHCSKLYSSLLGVYFPLKKLYNSLVYSDYIYYLYISMYVCVCVCMEGGREAGKVHFCVHFEVITVVAV